MKPSRIDKVNALLKREVYDIIQKEVKDPRIGFFTILRAEVDSEMSSAKIYIALHYKERTYSSSDDKTIEGLNSASQFIRMHLKKRLRMRVIPQLKFFEDDSFFISDEKEQDK